ncbi:traB domain-containing protein isoform X2 [Iris pallida]|uniref:TraB domain-containing protein isoform X2 n=1 Tax=Iris pallida TaxID=29817 RepID=A0AAX6FZJ8_IRIPA|nr:traB domain-containing protein isoform X2 [Iris pallida]
MEILTSPFPLVAVAIAPPLHLHHPKKKTGATRVAIRPPPPGFTYASLLEETRSAVSASNPDLMDLVEAGRLVRVPRGRFGPVPEWRSEFVEPDAIWLVATSHISGRSPADVARVVRGVRPDNVVVELCRSRQIRTPTLLSYSPGIMYTSNEGEDDAPAPLLKSNMFSLSGTQFFGAVNRSINLGGQSALALRLLLAVFSSKISVDANRPFGDEFRAARKAAEEVGAQIVLGDRPIEITLQRAWTSLTLTEKLKLIVSLFRGITSKSSVLSENNIKDEEMEGSTFKLYEQLGVSYPSLLQPLIHERDTQQLHDVLQYLAWSLKRSKAVNNSAGVVGVIGKGHMNGVIYALISDQGNLRFRDLTGRSSPGSSSGWVGSVAKSLVRDTIIGFILWALYEQLKVTL